VDIKKSTPLYPFSGGKPQVRAALRLAPEAVGDTTGHTSSLYITLADFLAQQISKG